MLTPVLSGQFRRDVKRAERRDKDLGKLRELLGLLIAQDDLPARYRDHPLKGEWMEFRDAHIEPDWLLIYGSSDGSCNLPAQAPIRTYSGNEALTDGSSQYDAWFRMKVQEALADNRPAVPHQRVMDKAQALIDRKRHARNSDTSSEAR